MDGLSSSSDFQFLQSFFPAFRDCYKHTHYNWHHHHPQSITVCLFFYFSDKISVFVYLFTLWFIGMAKSIWWRVLFFLTQHLVFCSGLVDLLISQNPREFYASETNSVFLSFSNQLKWHQVSSSFQDSSQYPGQF